MTGPIGTGSFGSLGPYGAETEAARAGRRQDAERQQYITKIPSSSFLRITPERTDRLNAADALFAVPVAEQQRLVERFIDYAEQVRGAQLHLLREHDGSPVEQRFLQQVELLQRPFAATDAAADITGQSRANSSSNGISYGISNGSTSMAASVGTKECLRGQHPSFVRFRLIEGAVSSLVLGPGGGSGCGSQVQMRTSSGFQGGDSDAVTHGSSTISTNGEGEEEETLFACQLESFLQLAVNEIATNELMGWEGQAETKNAAAVQLRCRRVVMAGALVPLALDDTLVIEHKVTLRRGTVSSTSNKAPQANGAPPEGTPSGALDIAGDTERLRDTLHQHAYQGCLRVPVTDQFKPAFTPLRAPRDTCDWASQLDGSAVVQLDPKLQEFVPQLRQRFRTLTETLAAIKDSFGSLEAFAEGHKLFGLQREVVDGVCGYAYREWLPNAKAVYLFGDFNNWDRSSHPLKRERRAVAPSFFEASLGALKGVKADLLAEQAPGEQLSSVWSIFIPDNSDGSPALSHRCRLRVLVVPQEGDPIDRVPSWSRVVWRSEDSGLFNAVLWNPPEEVGVFCVE
ncbi:glycan synthetase, putative [Eimeria acervulina]|uniref:Glycan synthetase, putative n=1 Tax=Eimeria acervulina TaxID=5801 RepID=U6GYS9_EIMAC|nr:glycan synthetase, putative [Eimeria acervulina]CDI83669.1 glycan synthetase, putative [Eimeria acervulina]